MLSARLFALALGLFVASGVPAGCSAGVVGGECRAGYSACSGRCVDQLTDAEHCGSCSHSCDDGTPCVSGICGGSDASTGGTGGNGGGRSGGASGLANGGTAGVAGTAGRGAASGRDGGTETDSSVGDAGAEGGTSGRGGRGGTAGTGGRSSGGTAGVAGRGGTAGTGGSITDAQTCFPPYDTAAHCGDCDTRCVEPAQLCSLGNDGYFCTTRCSAPLSECGTQCVNFDTDENNCGECGRRCASGICQGRQCVGMTAGHDVVLCMDYSTPAPADSSPSQLLGNAVFLGPKSAVRVLAYSEYAQPQVMATVRASLGIAASNRGRTYTLTNSATSLDVANRLSVANFEVLLVYDQPTAPAGRLLSAGTTIADAVDSFVRAGGIVTVLAGAGGRGEMPDFITGAGLVTVTGQEVVTGELLYDRAPADAIGVNVLSPFRAPRESCRFISPAPSDAFTVFVVTDTPSSSGVLGAPAVIHRVVAP
jgi:hypothetical protein